MKFIYILILTSFSAYSSAALYSNVALYSVNKSESNQTIILSAILKNYLLKYFDSDNTFVSFIIPISSKPENHFLCDVFLKLFSENKRFFPYNTLRKLDDFIHDHRRAFNVILTDDPQSIS